MYNKETEEKIKQFDKLITHKKEELTELNRKWAEIKKWGWNPEKEKYLKKVSLFEG